MKSAKSKSGLFFAGLLLAGAVTVLWGQSLSAAIPTIRVWQWEGVGWLLLGLPFILLQTEAGLPEVWEPAVSIRQRIWYPLLIGLAFAIPDVVLIGFVLHPEPYEALPPFTQPFPYSLALYGAGAIEIEIFYRLIPITLVLWLVGKVLLKSRYPQQVFWIIAVLSAIREPLEQFPDGTVWFMVYATVTGFAFNLLQAVYFRKAGFAAALMIRLGHYSLWHILFGIYLQYGVIGC